MRSDWKKTTIDEACARVYSGGTPSTKEPAYWNGDMNWLSSGETRNKFIYETERKITKLGVEQSSTQLAFKDSIVIATAGQGYTRGQASFLKIDTYVNQSVLVLEADRTMVEPLFLYYNLSNRYEELRQLSDGTSTRGGLSGWIVRRMAINLPPIDIQKKIIDVLYAIDQKIECNIAINKNLEEQVSAIYQAWFEDFSCSDGIRPYEWTMCPLADIADVTSGKRPPVKSTYQTKETPIPILGASSIMGFTSAENYSDHILVIGRVGTHGIVQRFNGSCWASDNTLVIRSKFYEYVNQILQRVDYHSMNRGSTQPLITQSDIKNVAVLLPDHTTLSKFEKIVASLMAVYESNLLESTKLIVLRDTLLPRLMSGELDVSHIEL